MLCEISDALSPAAADEDDRSGLRSSAGAWTPRSRPWAGAGVRADAAARSRLAEVVQLGGAELLTVNPEILGYYAHLADELCRTELQLVDPTKDRQGTLEDMVVGEAVFGEILALFRRLGHEHYDEQRTPRGPPSERRSARPRRSRGGRSRPRWRG